MRNRVKAVFLGTLIGDALGMPVESFSNERIKKTYGRISRYLKPKDHKWFSNEEAGTYTDDTQLTLAVARGMLESNDPLDINSQVIWHVKAYDESTKGWGNSTRSAVKNLKEGVSFDKSAFTGEGISGLGNGVAMKIAAPAIFLWKNNKDLIKSKEITRFLATLSKLTHPTSISISATFAQAMAINKCLSFKQGEFNYEEFATSVINSASLGKLFLKETIKDDLPERLADLFINVDCYDTNIMIDKFNNGSCYCYNSIPFVYGFFVKNPRSIESLYDIVSAGGDTDSNGAMLGALLGALNGMEIFPDHLISDLKNSSEILEVADTFCDKFEID